VGVRVGVAYSRNILALLTRLRNLNLKSQIYNFRDIRVHIYDFLKFVGVENFFLSQSIGIDENNLKLNYGAKKPGVRRKLRKVLWWTYHPLGRNDEARGIGMTRCQRCMP